MADEDRTALLAHTTKRYLNGYLFLAWKGERVNDSLLKQSIDEMERLEQKLKELGATTQQLDRLLNYGQIYKSLYWDQVTDVAMQQVMKVTFNLII